MERMAKVLDVSTSGYYGSRPESGREQERLIETLLRPWLAEKAPIVHY